MREWVQAWEEFAWHVGVGLTVIGGVQLVNFWAHFVRQFTRERDDVVG